MLALREKKKRNRYWYRMSHAAGTPPPVWSDDDMFDAMVDELVIESGDDDASTPNGSSDNDAALPPSPLGATRDPNDEDHQVALDAAALRTLASTQRDFVADTDAYRRMSGVVRAGRVFRGNAEREELAEGLQFAERRGQQHSSEAAPLLEEEQTSEEESIDAAPLLNQRITPAPEMLKRAAQKIDMRLMSESARRRSTSSESEAAAVKGLERYASAIFTAPRCLPMRAQARTSRVLKDSPAVQRKEAEKSPTVETAALTPLRRVALQRRSDDFSPALDGSIAEDRTVQLCRTIDAALRAKMKQATQRGGGGESPSVREARDRLRRTRRRQKRFEARRAQRATTPGRVNRSRQAGRRDAPARDPPLPSPSSNWSPSPSPEERGTPSDAALNTTPSRWSGFGWNGERGPPAAAPEPAEPSLVRTIVAEHGVSEPWAICALEACANDVVAAVRWIEANAATPPTSAHVNRHGSIILNVSPVSSPSVSPSPSPSRPAPPPPPRVAEAHVPAAPAPPSAPQPKVRARVNRHGSILINTPLDLGDLHGTQRAPPSPCVGPDAWVYQPRQEREQFKPWNRHFTNEGGAKEIAPEIPVLEISTRSSPPHALSRQTTRTERLRQAEHDAARAKVRKLAAQMERSKRKTDRLSEQWRMHGGATARTLHRGKRHGAFRAELLANPTRADMVAVSIEYDAGSSSRRGRSESNETVYSTESQARNARVARATGAHQTVYDDEVVRAMLMARDDHNGNTHQMQNHFATDFSLRHPGSGYARPNLALKKVAASPEESFASQWFAEHANFSDPDPPAPPTGLAAVLPSSRTTAPVAPKYDVHVNRRGSVDITAHRRQGGNGASERTRERSAVAAAVVPQRSRGRRSPPPLVRAVSPARKSQSPDLITVLRAEVALGGDRGRAASTSLATLLAVPTPQPPLPAGPPPSMDALSSKQVAPSTLELKEHHTAAVTHHQQRPHRGRPIARSLSTLAAAPLLPMDVIEPSPELIAVLSAEVKQGGEVGRAARRSLALLVPTARVALGTIEPSPELIAVLRAEVKQGGEVGRAARRSLALLFPTMPVALEPIDPSPEVIAVLQSEAAQGGARGRAAARSLSLLFSSPLVATAPFAQSPAIVAVLRAEAAMGGERGRAAARSLSMVEEEPLELFEPAVEIMVVEAPLVADTVESPQGGYSAAMEDDVKDDDGMMLSFRLRLVQVDGKLGVKCADGSVMETAKIEVRALCGLFIGVLCFTIASAYCTVVPL